MYTIEENVDEFRLYLIPGGEGSGTVGEEDKENDEDGEKEKV